MCPAQPGCTSVRARNGVIGPESLLSGDPGFEHRPKHIRKAHLLLACHLDVQVAQVAQAQIQVLDRPPGRLDPGGNLATQPGEPRMTRTPRLLNASITPNEAWQYALPMRSSYGQYS